MKNTFYVILFILLASCQSSASQRLAVNDTTLDYAVFGHGPPLYLLHGGMESRDSFSKQIPALTKYFTVVALDSREQGRSARAATQISYELMAADVAALAQHLGHERISVLGQSDGGITALTVARNNPALIENLILLGTNYHYEAYPEETREFIAGYEWDGSEDNIGFPGMFIPHYLTGQPDLSDFGSTLKEMAVMWTTSPTFSIDDLKKIRARTLIINGDREDIALEHQLSLYKNIPEAELFIVPGATHFLHQERPELVNNAVIAFLAD